MILHASLFFNQVEYDKRKKNVKYTDFRYEKLSNQKLYFEGMVFHSPDDYTLWINGSCYHPSSDPIDEHIKIVEVSPAFVKLNVHGKVIVLKPCETYETGTGKTVYGDMRKK